MQTELASEADARGGAGKTVNLSREQRNSTKMQYHSRGWRSRQKDQPQHSSPSGAHALSLDLSRLGQDASAS